MLSQKLVREASKYVVVAVLFALCGGWSAQFPMPEHFGWMNCVLPLPFAVLCAMLFMRTSKAALAVTFMVAVWLAAYLTAMAVGMLAGHQEHLIPVGMGGFIGGLGVALSASVCHRRLLSPTWLLAAALTGCAAALPFGFWLRSYYLTLNSPDDPLQPLRLRYAFAIWQGAVGTYLYAVCTRAKEKAPQADSQIGDRL